MTAAWPTELPGPLPRSLVVNPRENVIKGPSDIGAPATRRRYTSRLIDYSAQLLLTDALRLVLDRFHNYDCEDGNLSFTMTDWIGGTTITCKWISPPQFSEAGNFTHYFASVQFVKIE